MKNIHIDFQIYDSNDPTKILVLDTSEWSQLKDSPSILEIITPGEVDARVINYSKNSVNVLNSFTLGLDCTLGSKIEYTILPDGVYQLTLKGSPDTFSKKRLYLKTTNIQSKLDELIISQYSDCTSCSEINDDLNKILRYFDLIKVAEAFVREGNLCEAQNILFKIQKFVEKFKTCKKCPHKV